MTLIEALTKIRAISQQMVEYAAREDLPHLAKLEKERQMLLQSIESLWASAGDDARTAGLVTEIAELDRKTLGILEPWRNDMAKLLSRYKPMQGAS